MNDRYWSNSQKQMPASPSCLHEHIALGCLNWSGSKPTSVPWGFLARFHRSLLHPAAWAPSQARFPIREQWLGKTVCGFRKAYEGREEGLEIRNAQPPQRSTNQFCSVDGGLCFPCVLAFGAWPKVKARIFTKRQAAHTTQAVVELQTCHCYSYSAFQTFWLELDWTEVLFIAKVS